jgi:hypothetical protein
VARSRLTPRISPAPASPPPTEVPVRVVDPEGAFALGTAGTRAGDRAVRTGPLMQAVRGPARAGPG